jgi:bacterial/archaeal transporter family-2 protein
MSGATAVAVLVSVSAGLAGSMQAAVMGKLGDRIGSMEAVGFAAIVAGVAGLAAMLVARRSFDGVAAALHEPAWLWIGGVLSAFIVVSITVATPRIGVTAAIAMVIAGQLAAAALIDRFGWFGFERVALEWPRVLGIVLLAAGAALTLRR